MKGVRKMNMMKWLVLLVFSFSFIVGCSQNEVKTDTKVAGKQIEKKEEKKQEEKKQEEQKQEDSKQEQKPTEEQKQEEKQKEEKAAEPKSIEENQSQTKTAEPSQNQKEQSKVVNEPKETQKQENEQQARVNPESPKPPVPPKPEVKAVTLSVKDDQGTILGETEVELQDGDTVFKVLGRTLKKKGIQMEYTGSGSGVYVQGINNLYEKSKGAGSGWMYRVNGVAVNKGAGSYKVKQGDKIEWFYSLDYRKEDR